MRIIATLLLALLVGCSHTKDIIIPDNRQVSIPSEILEQCQPLKEDIKASTFADLLIIYGDIAMLYGDCASKQNSSITLIKQFGNIK